VSKVLLFIIDSCDDCYHSEGGYCCHPTFPERKDIPDDDIPSWCPLEEAKKCEED